MVLKELANFSLGLEACGSHLDLLTVSGVGVGGGDFVTARHVATK